MDQFYKFLNEEKKVFIVFLISALFSQVIACAIFVATMIFSENKILKQNMMQIIGLIILQELAINIGYFSSSIVYQIGNFTSLLSDMIRIGISIYLISEIIRINKRDKLKGIEIAIVNKFVKECFK